MALFQKKIGPIFLKEESDAANFIDRMEEIGKKSSGDLKNKIDEQIKLARYGIAGENNIAFELKNSGIDMYILHDIYLEYEDLSAQIDYMIFTRKHIYVIECKNLIGNIEIDNTGKFIRTYEMNGKRIKEGIYSPITQNERHMLVLKNLRKSSKINFITRALFDRNFEDVYKSIVVLANPKTYLNDKFAKKEIKQQVIRADQLIDTIRKLDAEVTDVNWSETEMREPADFFLANSKPNKSDYAVRYEELVKEQEASIKSESLTEKKDENATNEKHICPQCGNQLMLRTARTGVNAGKQFWGCSGYPKCKYIENIK